MTTAHDRPRPSTKAEQAAVTRERLIESAIELYGAHGYAQTTLSMVCANAGYSRGIIAHYFGSKTEFTKAVIEEIRIRARDRSADAVGRTGGLPALTAYVEYYIHGVAVHEKRRRTVNTLSEAAATSEPELHGLVAEHNRAFVKAFTRELDTAKKLRQIDPDINSHAIAYSLVALVRGLVQLWAIDPQGLDLTEIATESRRLLAGLYRGGAPS